MTTGVASLALALGLIFSGDGVNVSPGDDNFGVSVLDADPGDVKGGQTFTGITETSVPTATEVANTDLDSFCIHLADLAGVAPDDFCDPAGEDGEPPTITPGMVAQALAQVPVPPSALQVQPPNGRTLVNFETNFFTTTREFDRTVVLLGQRVDLHIVPSSFTWQFGDGESATTSEPGAPYPELDITHTYLKKGRVAPSVDTTYIADFRVNGGPWADVPGTVTIAGAPVDLQVLTATPTLVGYDRR